ncbi:MAG: glycosyltransferase [Proteobacteria bacterium]|nr:glycosyltransferase [Pseudomonadota bacterium]
MIKVLICCLNEEKNLPKLFPDLFKELKKSNEKFEVFMCIDGTSDRSPRVISEFQKSHKITVLPKKSQRGLGLAYKRLFVEVIENSADEDLLITLDADNTHNPQQITEMIKHFKNNSLDLLVASRFCGNSVMSNFPIHRRFISKGTSLLLQNIFAVKRISGEKLQDYSSGYRIYKNEKLKKLFAKEKEDFITEPEFTYTCELLIKLSRLNSRLDEIPIFYDYGKKVGKSKLRIGRNFWRLLVMLRRLF